jgi:iron complex outermembrane receptor protein
LKQSFAPRDGRLGLVFAANREVSAYMQYATGSEPIEALLILGPAESGFALAHTRLWEGGIKANAAQGRLDFTAAVYHLGKRNLTTTDPEDSTRTIQIGAQSSRGVELAVTARPHPTLLVEANVAALDARYDRFREGTVSRDGNLPPNVPETVFNVGSTWRPITRLEAGFWLTHVGRRAADTTNTVFQPAFTLVDPFARISLGPRADLTLRVRNATGQRYAEWATRAFGVTNVYFGEPRRTILSLRFRL